MDCATKLTNAKLARHMASDSQHRSSESSGSDSRNSALPSHKSDTHLQAVNEEITESTKITDMPRVSDQHLKTGKFTISLTAREAGTPAANIQIKTFINNVLSSNNNYPLRHIYQSTLWPDALREAQSISIAIALGRQTDKAARVAMNYTLAGLLTFLDAASSIEALRLQLLDGHSLSNEELYEVFQPIAIWARHTPDISPQIVDLYKEVSSRLDKKKFLVSRSDDSVDRLFSVLRIAARATARLDQAGMRIPIMELRHGMRNYLDELGFIGPGCTTKAEAAMQEVQKLLSRILKTV